MFGHTLDPPEKPPPPPKRPFPPDIQMADVRPYSWAHYARAPNTDYHIKLLHYKQRLDAFDAEREEQGKKARSEEMFEKRYTKHVAARLFRREVEDRVRDRLKAYEDSIQERRDRLRKILAEEECSFYEETVKKAKEHCDSKMDVLKKKAEEIKKKEEMEREELAKRKKIQQYMARCEDLRKAFSKKWLIESKHGQLQQMRENEARREAERELEKMWLQIMEREDQDKFEREKQDAIEQYNRIKEMEKVWEIQMKGKELLKAENARIMEDDRKELQRVMEQRRKEEIEALDEKRRKRNKATQELLEQIAAREKLLEQRRKDEIQVDNAFNYLTQLEIEREKAKVQDTTTAAKRETAIYRQNLRELEEERKREEALLDELLERERKEIEKKQDEAKCKILQAKEALKKSVMEGRAQQLEWKRQEAEYQLKLKEAENDLLRMSIDANERLNEYAKIREREAAQAYKKDLHEQIKYNNLLRERERKELEKQLEMGMEEERRYQQMVEDVLSGRIKDDKKHPFRKLLEQYDCRCNVVNPKN